MTYYFRKILYNRDCRLVPPSIKKENHWFIDFICLLLDSMAICDQSTTMRENSEMMGKGSTLVKLREE